NGNTGFPVRTHFRTYQGAASTAPNARAPRPDKARRPAAGRSDGVAIRLTCRARNRITRTIMSTRNTGVSLTESAAPTANATWGSHAASRVVHQRPRPRTARAV